MTENIFGVLVFTSSSIAVTCIPRKNTWKLTSAQLQKSAVCYSKHVSQSLRCYRHFFHSSFYSSFSFSWEKNNVTFLHCNRNTRPNQDRSWWNQLHGNLLYLYFRVSFISVMSPEKKKEKKKIDHRFSFFHFSEKLKFDTGFLFSFFLCSEKNNNIT